MLISSLSLHLAQVQIKISRGQRARALLVVAPQDCACRRRGGVETSNTAVFLEPDNQQDGQ